MNKCVLLNVPLVVGALALVGCATSPPVAVSQSVPLGVDLGASKPMPPIMPNVTGPVVQGTREAGGHGSVRQVQAGRTTVRASGVINSVDTQHHMVNISHRAIPAIGWPPMTMDFSVASSVNLDAFAPETQVNFTLQKSSDGMYQIHSLEPAKPER